MTRTILGLDVGGANLKAATPDGRAVSVPFALWKQPDKLPAALADLVGRFPDVGELAVTMTGELCDCYETKRQGVSAILDAVELAAAGRPVRVWDTGRGFLTAAASRADYMTVAAANWHVLAMFVARFVTSRAAVLVDVGSTTTDVIPLLDGQPAARGRTDPERMHRKELVYVGVRRTPVCAVCGPDLVASELFATAHDAYLLLDEIAEDAADRDTADGRPATKAFAHARLCRMLGGDEETIPAERTVELARTAVGLVESFIGVAIELALCDPPGRHRPEALILAGVGEFAARRAIPNLNGVSVPVPLSLTEQLGPAISACAPAYAVAVLASERPS